MSEGQSLLKRQAAWQKSRKHLSWPDKVRMVESMHLSLRQLRNSGHGLCNFPTPDSAKRQPLKDSASQE
jgi:hypothetical protein